MLFLTILFLIVLLLLAYALSADKGRNTIHARKTAQLPSRQPMSHMTKKANSAAAHLH